MEPWELPDADIWDEIGPAALVNLRERLTEEMIAPYCGLTMEQCVAIANGLAQTVQSICETTEQIRARLAALTAPPTTRPPHQRGPRTAPRLREALQARPTLRPHRHPAPRQHRRQQR